VLEFASTFITQNVVNPYSYSAMNWSLFYREPVNSDGFRGEELENGEDYLVCFIGDSFTEGDGINNFRKRFSNLFEERTNLETFNLGVSNSSTKDQIETLKNMKTVPDVIVWQYFINDIEGSSAKFGWSLEPSFQYERLIMSSFLINNIFTRINTLDNPKYSYVEKLKLYYSNAEIVADHRSDLCKIVEYCSKMDSELFFIVIPYLRNPAQSAFVSNFMINWLLENNIPFMDLAEFVEKIPVKQRVVNKYDPHASEQLNYIIAERLIQELRITGTLSD